MAGFETGVVNQVPVGNGQVPFRQIDGKAAHVMLAHKAFDIVDKLHESIGICRQREGMFHVLGGKSLAAAHPVPGILFKQTVVIMR